MNTQARRLRVRTALVTGCTRGIGAAIAGALRADGMRVIGTGSVERVVHHVDEYFGVDFADTSEVERFASKLAGLEVDVLVNNAGINIVSGFLDVRLADFEQVQRINLVAPFLLSQAVLPHMLRQRWGRIVNISSVWGKVARTGRAAYSASKFGIDGMTLSLAHEFASRGVLANCVAPGFIDTELTWRNLGEEGVARVLADVPVGRLAEVEEVARLVAWLASDANTYLSGQNIAIDGGFTRA